MYFSTDSLVLVFLLQTPTKLAIHKLDRSWVYCKFDYLHDSLAFNQAYRK